MKLENRVGPEAEPFTPFDLERAIRQSFGDLKWWPAEGPFEVCVGAILTQNTNWTNVERAIVNLKRDRLLEPQRIVDASHEEIASAIRPSGYFNQKAERLQLFSRWLLERFGSIDTLIDAPEEALRAELLALKGIGPETADSILCYAAKKPRFVVDAYTFRILNRHQLQMHTVGYAQCQHWFEQSLPADPARLGNIHAGIVEIGKRWCRPRLADCANCALRAFATQVDGKENAT